MPSKEILKNSWIVMKKALPDIRKSHEGETLLYKGEILQIEALHKIECYPNENYFMFKNKNWEGIKAIRYAKEYFEFSQPYTITIKK